MKKLSLICIVAMATLVMTSCGTKNAKKAEVEAVETEVVTEAPATTLTEEVAPETVATDAAATETVATETAATI